jgi:very-short-patch-repair endonuclease
MTRKKQAEMLLWQHLKGKQTGWEIERNHKFGKYKFFYCPKAKTAFDIWDEETDETKVDIFEDENKRAILGKLDIQYFVVSADEILSDAEKIVLKIVEKLI